MLSLSIQVGTDLSNLSWIIAARSFGYVITIILFGIIFVLDILIKNHQK